MLILQNEFKPEVEQWGQKGTLELAKILDCAKGPVSIDPNPGGEVPDEVEEMAKKEAGLRRQDSGSIKPVNAMLGGIGQNGDGDDGAAGSDGGE